MQIMYPDEQFQMIPIIVDALGSEVATGGVQKKLLLEILQNSQENTCARVSFLIKLQA